MKKPASYKHAKNTRIKLELDRRTVRLLSRGELCRAAGGPADRTNTNGAKCTFIGCGESGDPKGN